MSFGQRLQEVRRSNGMTQEDFAQQLKVSRQAVSKWESARGYPEIEKIIYICNRYGVTMDELFAEEVPSSRKDSAPPPESMESRTLKTALDAFFSNLSPQNKWIGAGSLAAAALLILVIVQCMRGGANSMATIVWIGVIIAFGIAEAVTTALVSIWFVAGAVAALLAAVFDCGVRTQLIWFVLVSALALVASRPLARRLTANTRTVPTNADRTLGQTARVTETIDNGNATGSVYVDGKTWTARSEDGAVIPAGAQVTIARMEGVKLFVKTCEEKVEVML
jgi:membrane protein implicated in regulation of membrane protease activity/transcriptional regulator with XRE-family HTH domain